MSTPFPTGGRVFPLPNQTGQATPDVKKDNVSVYVEAARLPKSSNWFKSDSSLGLSFKVVANYLAGSSAFGTSSSTITVTKTYSFDVTRDASGNVVLPLHSLAVVDTCPLMTTNAADKAFLSNLDINLTFLATRDSTGFSIALQEVFKLSGKLPIPNPYTPYVALLGDGISNVVQTIQSQNTNPQPLSTIAFQFAGPTASLSGYYILLMSTDQDIGNGFVDIYNLTPSQLGYDSAKGLTSGGQACQNAHVVFRVAYPVSPFLRVASSQLAANLLDTRGFLASTGLTAHLFLDEFLAGEAKGESTQGAGRSSITKRTA